MKLNVSKFEAKGSAVGELKEIFMLSHSMNNDHPAEKKKCVCIY